MPIRFFDPQTGRLTYVNDRGVYTLTRGTKYHLRTSPDITYTFLEPCPNDPNTHITCQEPGGDRLPLKYFVRMFDVPFRPLETTLEGLYYLKRISRFRRILEYLKNES